MEMKDGEENDRTLTGKDDGRDEKEGVATRTKEVRKWDKW